LKGIMLSNFKKVIALLSVFALLIVYAPVAMAAEEADTVTIYHETFAGGKGAAANAGDAVIEPVSGKVFVGNEDGNALYIKSRKNNWDGADFKFTDIGLVNGRTYTITVKGYVDAGEEIPDGAQAFLQNISSYGWIAGANFEAGKEFTLKGTYTVDTSEDSALRVQSNDAGKTVPFYIGEIIITGEPSGSDDEGPGTSFGKNEVYHETFADGIGKAKVSGSAKLEAVDKAFAGYDDGKALYVSNRSNNWDAADFGINDIGLIDGETYTITVKGFVDDDVEVPDGGQAFLQTVDSYSWLDGADLLPGSAFTLIGTYTVDTSKDRAIRVQSNDAAKTVPFYIGDVLVTQGSKEIYHEDFASGKGKAVQSGGANLTAVDKAFTGYDDGKALYVSNRSVEYDAADFPFEDVNMVDGRTYRITVKGYIDPDVEVASPGAKLFIKTNNNYIELASVEISTGAAVTLTCEYTVNEEDGDTAFRVQSNEEGANIPFYIGDVSVAKVTLPFTTVTFEGDQGDAGFIGRNGAEILTVTDEENHTDGGKYALKVEGRSDTWHGPSLRVEKYISEGSEYKVTAWVKLIEPASAQIALSTQIDNGSGASYINLESKTVSSGDGWVKLEGTYRYNNMKSDYATIYIESPNSKTASYYIDDISFVNTGSGPLDIQKDLTPIKGKYKDDFLIGNAISAEDLSGVRLDLLKMHHNVATAGNAMKPDALQPTKGNFSFTAADEMVNKVLDEEMKMHGHTLVWHSQSPDWLNKNEDGSYLSREEALENMRTHIKTVVEHFGDRVISWDVVNEGMNDNPSNPSDWRASLRQSPWYYAVGDDYIEQAFLAAREVLDEHPDWNIKLYYNDYNDDNQSKATAIYNMVKELNDKYAETHPGKKLIDGIGMQAHYNLSTNPDNVKRSLEKFISLGVEVSVTELDIMAGDNGKLTEDQAKKQAYLYAQLFEIYKEHSDKIARVTFWGMDDGSSWRASNSPLLFDKNLQAKPAYYAVIDPEKYMEENPPELPPESKKGTASYGTPVIDGTIDSIWDTTEALPVNQYQMAWQGASGTAKVLWDDSNLYVLIQVNDTVLDKASANAWEQDSVEVFLDENNAKTSYYEDDDGQYRVNYDNETSFNPESIKEGFVSAAKTGDAASYVVEMKIPFRTITPANDVKIGFDAQINDGKDGSRISAATWNDLTGVGYQDTSVFGVLTLKKGSDDSGSGSNSGSGSKKSSSSTPDVKVEQKETKAEVSVSVPTAKASDGSVIANVYGSYIDAVVKEAANFKKNNADQASTIRFALDTSADKVTAKLPEKALDKILEADPDASMEIVAGQCELGLDNKALEAVSKAGTGATEINVSKLGYADLAMISSEAVEKVGDRPIYNIGITNGGNAVTDFNGGTLTVSIPYKLAEGEDPNAILVYYIDSNDNLIPVVSRYVDGKVIFTTTHLSKYAVGYNKVSFADVNPTDYFYAPVTYLGARGVITGSSFEPERATTRGEAVVMILKAYGIEPLENPTDNFSDVSGEYAGYYAKAKAIGLSNGIGNNVFGADLELTREMLFTMVSRMENIVGEFPSVAEGKKASSFSDYSELSGWAASAVSNLTEKGIIIGAENNTLKPKAIAKRSETVTMLYKLVNG
jgi:endo-1,4-beta-xylanase